MFENCVQAKQIKANACKVEVHLYIKFMEIVTFPELHIFFNSTAVCGCFVCFLIFESLCTYKDPGGDRQCRDKLH